MHGSQCGDSPKTLCSAEDRPSPVHRASIGIMLKNCPSILDHQDGNSSSALGICCGARAIGVLDFGKPRCRYEEINCYEQSAYGDRARCVARAPLVWGAQAASLSFSATCRKVHRKFITRGYCNALGIVGKLPTTTGWQPVLPSRRRHHVSRNLSLLPA